jgi:hypothetical protein
MNERIKELAEQAGITTNLDTDFYEKDMNKWVDYFSEKFAELIVRECTNMLPPDSIRDENGVHMFYVIRKHFGVSEIGR